MLFRSLAVASALSLASPLAAHASRGEEDRDGGNLVRMKLTRRSNHEMVAQFLQRENDALRLAMTSSSGKKGGDERDESPSPPLLPPPPAVASFAEEDRPRRLSRRH